MSSASRCRSPGPDALDACCRDLCVHQLSKEIVLIDLGTIRLRDLSRPERVYQATQSGLVYEFPSLRSIDAVSNNLPFQRTIFIGRETEAASIERRRVVEQIPELAERIRGARREAPFAGAAVPNFFRKPYGHGWVLVGDAGYLKDPVTAQGITDAFLDAERGAGALDETFRGARSFDEAMNAFQRTRDEHALPMYEFTCQLAALEPPDEGLQQLLAAIQGNQPLMDAFVQSYAGTISPCGVFRPENVGAIMTAAKHVR